MQEKELLIIDKEFKSLTGTPSRGEYMQMEKQIRQFGCKNPITVWNGYVVDGFLQYEICSRLRIPMKKEEIEFVSREAAIAWICEKQLSLNKHPEEMRRYLIGKQYISSKLVYRKFPSQIESFCAEYSDYPELLTRHRTANKVAIVNHVSYATVQKYAIYARAIDVIANKVPSFAPKILAGHCRISHFSTIELSQLSPNQIKRLERLVDQREEQLVPFAVARATIRDLSKLPIEDESQSKRSIKDMPEFDPDAEINGLALTVPSWTSSVERIHTSADLSIASSRAKKQLRAALMQLEEVIDMMLVALTEVKK